MTNLRFCIAVAVLATQAAAAGAADAPPFARRTLANGAVLLVSEQRALPMVDVEILLDAGSRRDPDGREGLASLTADLLNEGTARHDASSLAEAVDGLGASLTTGAAVDSASVDLRVLRKDLERGLELLAEVLLQPTFPAAELERRREAVLAGMRAAEDNPGLLGYRAFLGLVYGGEPYGHLTEGTPEAVRAITRDDVRAFYARHYGPGRAIVTVVGDIGADEAVALLNEALGGWQAGADAAPFAYPEEADAAPAVRVIRKPLSQTNIVLGHRGIARDDPDYYAVEVMNYILGGGGFGSRLLDRVRTEHGLAYAVSSGFATPKFPGSFRVSMQTKRESTREALRLTCAELLRIRSEPVDDDELEGAKLYLTGNFPLQLDSNRKIAAFLGSIEFFGLGDDYARRYVERIAAVTKDDVQRAAREHLHPERLHLVLVGDVDWPEGQPLDCNDPAADESAAR